MMRLKFTDDSLKTIKSRCYGSWVDARNYDSIFPVVIIMLALSSLSRSARFAGINFAAVFFFSQILYGILRTIFRTTSVAWISLGTNLTQVGDLLFGTKPSYSSPQWLSVLILTILIAGSALLIRRKVQAVEVVS